MKKNIYLFEINDILTNQAKLPYSTGLIWSYCRTIEGISNNFNLDKLFWWRSQMHHSIWWLAGSDVGQVPGLFPQISFC